MNTPEAITSDVQTEMLRLRLGEALELALSLHDNTSVDPEDRAYFSFIVGHIKEALDDLAFIGVPKP